MIQRTVLAFLIAVGLAGPCYPQASGQYAPAPVVSPLLIPQAVRHYTTSQPVVQRMTILKSDKTVGLKGIIGLKIEDLQANQIIDYSIDCTLSTHPLNIVGATNNIDYPIFFGSLPFLSTHNPYDWSWFNDPTPMGIQVQSGTDHWSCCGTTDKPMNPYRQESRSGSYLVKQDDVDNERVWLILMIWGNSTLAKLGDGFNIGRCQMDAKQTYTVLPPPPPPPPPPPDPTTQP